ncbi:hypothetical protein CEXT_705411 [Caerostris extrusa]|uniref:Uncharacterized protein n=1 Tax=Caerostris extrusa TaxID=172846 RepID=A0AAV4TTN6_CAEEX|nr:hypothetical protein CEXT_705411 [Caerostris extrusa]
MLFVNYGIPYRKSDQRLSTRRRHCLIKVTLVVGGALSVVYLATQNRVEDVTLADSNECLLRGLNPKACGELTCID